MHKPNALWIFLKINCTCIIKWQDELDFALYTQQTSRHSHHIMPCHDHAIKSKRTCFQNSNLTLTFNAKRLKIYCVRKIPRYNRNVLKSSPLCHSFRYTFIVDQTWDNLQTCKKWHFNYRQPAYFLRLLHANRLEAVFILLTLQSMICRSMVMGRISWPFSINNWDDKNDDINRCNLQF